MAILLISSVAVPFVLANETANNSSEADLNDDGLVDDEDKKILLKNWGPCSFTSNPKCIGDLNDDKNVGMPDLLDLLAAWNPTPNSDLNEDGVVDNKDLKILVDAWGKCENSVCKADLNNDKIVDMKDLLMLLKNWTQKEETAVKKQSNLGKPNPSQSAWEHANENARFKRTDDMPTTSNVKAKTEKSIRETYEDKKATKFTDLKTSG